MPSYMTPARESFIPTQLYQPDFESIGGILRTKQMQYDQGFNQLKSTFNSILNAPLTVDENKVVRQQYIDQARDQLKNLPKADLSIQQVQSQAQEVFNPFYEDQDIVKDMVKTKQFNQQFQFAENLRNSKKPEEQAQYWDMGVQYLNNGLEKLRTAKRGDGSIDKVEARRYVNYFDSQKFLDEEAKAEGLKIERSTAQGPYKITRLNGDDTPILYETWAASKLSGNIKANDMFRVEGTVLYENQLNNLVSNTGIPVEVAKTTLAKNYIDRQAARYNDSYERIKAHTKDLQTRIKKQEEVFTATPSAENAKEYESLQKQLQVNREELEPKYKELAEKFKDPNSKDYKDVYNSIINGGESFFAEHSRSNFITNWAKGRAANSSVTYDIDPGYKLNLELEKEKIRLDAQTAMFDIRYGNNSGTGSGSPSSSGSSGGSDKLTAAEKKLIELNTPLPVGLNVKGSDKISVFNRFVAAKKENLESYINSGLKFIEQMSFYSAGDSKTLTGNYLTQLRNQLTNTEGKFTPNKEAEAEHKQLQEAGIIPKELNFGAGPVRTFQAIKKYYSDVFLKQLKDGSAKTELVDLLSKEEETSEKYAELKRIEDKEIEQLKKDPKLSDLFSKRGDVYSFNEYTKSKGIDTSEKALRETYLEYKSIRAKTAASLGLGGGSTQSFENFKKEALGKIQSEYESKLKIFNDKFGKTSIAKGDEAYIGPGMQFEAGDKDDQTLAKKITSIIMGGENFTGQDITKDGIVPVNMDQLEKLGADRKELSSFLSANKANLRDLISRIQVTKIGVDGNPSIKLYLSQARIDDYSKDDKNQKLTENTAKAIGDGIEIRVNNPDLLKSQGLNLDFIPSSIDQLLLNKKGFIEAPKVLKQAGFDYNITKSAIDDKTLLIKFNYKLFKNGSFEDQPPQRYEVSLDGKNVDDIKRELLKTAMQIYSGNFQASAQYYKQNPQVPSNFIEETKKKYNYK